MAGGGTFRSMHEGCVLTALAGAGLSRPEAEAKARITEHKLKWGKDLCLLAHLYQRKAITELADFVGDSYGLSKSAANVEGGKYIVFCGVRFMAESAAICARTLVSHAA